jgi:hypothetical protein
MITSAEALSKSFRLYVFPSVPGSSKKGAFVPGSRVFGSLWLSWDREITPGQKNNRLIMNNLNIRILK